MPYSNNEDLPEDVKDALPQGAQTIFRKAFNSAEEQYDDEQKAIQTAWSAVKNEYKKDEDGNWVKKGYVVKSESDELQYTLGVVYSPYDVDLQGEYTDEKEIRKAEWDYMRKVQEDSVSEFGKNLLKYIKKAYEEDAEIRIKVDKLLEQDLEKRFKDNHSEWLDDDSHIVESYLAPQELEINGSVVRKGTWLLGVKWSDEMWKKIQEGERNGFSMGGRAEKV